MTSSSPQINALKPASIDESRRVLLDAIGAAPDLTLIQPYGNLGDELIWAGTRELLSGHVYREIGVDQVASTKGELALINGGGAWSRRYNEFMPEVLAIAEMRFERVIVLPSTFEVSEDRVREALERTNAIVFARECESFAQIQGLCRAQLAHDCAFYFDFSPYDAPGEGELNAFRTDDESLGLRPLPSDNDDISEALGSLEEWLRTIERHAVVNTDRAHVMIAAARMGKSVNYASSSYFKVDAIAEYALGGLDVSPLDGATATELPAPPPADAGSDPAAQVTVAVMSRDEASSVRHAADLLPAEEVDAELLVIDRNSRPRTRNTLVEIASQTPDARFRFANRDSGPAASIRLASELVESEFVVFLGEKMQIAPGALDLMVKALDQNPEALAVAPSVIDGSGAVLHCGGWTLIDSESITIEPSTPPAAGVTGWVPTYGTLFRRAALETTPLADGMDPICQNADWVLRASVGAGSLLACPDAVLTVADSESPARDSGFVERARAARGLASHANFYAAQGRLLSGPLAELVPELCDENGALDATAAKLLLELVGARGPSWTLMQWMNGGLELLLRSDADAALTQVSRDHLEWLEQRNESLIGIENGGWWKLRNRLNRLRGRSS